MIIKFYGHSDDNVEIEGDAPMLNGPDKGSTSAEWPAYTNDPNLVAAKFHIVGPSAKCEGCGQPKPPEHIVTVYAIYDGTWTFAATLADEEKSFPAGWTVMLSHKGGYSMELVIDTNGDDVAILKPDYDGGEDDD